MCCMTCAAWTLEDSTSTHWSLDTVSRLTFEHTLHDAREMWTIMNKDRFILVRREIHRGHPTAHCVIFNNLGTTWEYLTTDNSSFLWPKPGYVMARSTGRAATTLADAVLQPSGHPKHERDATVCAHAVEASWKGMTGCELFAWFLKTYVQHLAEMRSRSWGVAKVSPKPLTSLSRGFESCGLLHC